MKKEIFFIILMLFLMTISFAGCIFDDDSLEDYPHGTYQYIVEVKTNENNNYELIIPLPTHQKTNQVVEYIENVSVNGECSFEVINVSGDYGLKIIGNGNIKLEVKDKEYLDPIWLSLVNTTSPRIPNEIQYHIYYNSTNNISDIELWVMSFVNRYPEKYGYIGYHSTLYTERLINGWQWVEGKEAIEVS